MKEKIIKIFILFLIFIFSVFLIFLYKKPVKCKVLKVFEADELVLGFNGNDAPEQGKKVILRNVVAFKPVKNAKQSQYANANNLSEEEILKVGYLARFWAKDFLLNNDVEVLGLRNCYNNEVCKVDILVKRENYSDLLLKNGLGYLKDRDETKNSLLNTIQVKNNSLQLGKIEFLLKNLNSDTVHKLNCPHLKEIQNAQLYLKKELDLKTNTFCKKCLNINQSFSNSKLNIPKSGNIYKKSFHRAYKNIDLYFINPLENKMPSVKSNSEFAKRLINEIDSAKETIDIAIYEFGDQKDIYNALLNAKKRGVKIRAVSDISKNELQRHKIHFDFIKEFNAVLDSNTSLMHNKFLIFDNSLVMTGSANISSTGSGGYNANLVAFINDEQIIKRYKAEFNQMYSSKFSINKKVLNNYESDISAYFSPRDDICHEVLFDLIENAKKYIYISAFYLTDKELIEHLIQSKRKGLQILVLLDANSAANFKGRIDKLRKNNIFVAVENWGGKNHEKTMVIDGEILIFGSCNFSKSGFYKNDENIIVVKNKQIATQYSDYFLYLFNSIDKKFLFSIPRAESHDSTNSCFDGIDNNYDGKVDSDDEACKINVEKD